MTWLIGHMSAALLLVSSISVPPVPADMVAPRNGQRAEGTFKGANDSAVRIEIGGRIVTFAPAEVRAIYYGRSVRWDRGGQDRGRSGGGGPS
jgi:hypothetical protein